MTAPKMTSRQLIEGMTARQIIEARLGRKLPATRDLRPDQRTAIKLLAIQLIKARAEREGGKK